MTDHRVEPVSLTPGAQFFAVPSQSQPEQYHIVSRSAQHEPWRCDCKGFEHRGRCAHIERLHVEHPELLGSSQPKRGE